MSVAPEDAGADQTTAREHRSEDGEVAGQTWLDGPDINMHRHKARQQRLACCSHRAWQIEGEPTAEGKHR